MVSTQDDDVKTLVDTRVCKLGKIVKMRLRRRIDTARDDRWRGIIAPINFEIINKSQIAVGGIHHDFHAGLHGVRRNTEILFAITGSNRRIVILRLQSTLIGKQKQAPYEYGGNNF